MFSFSNITILLLLSSIILCLFEWKHSLFFIISLEGVSLVFLVKMFYLNISLFFFLLSVTIIVVDSLLMMMCYIKSVPEHSSFFCFSLT